MHLKSMCKRIISLFIAGVVMVSLFSLPSLADETETSSSEVNFDLTNPVDGLLDPSPSQAPVTNSRAYLIYDTLSNTMLIGYDYDSKRQPAAITQIMTVLIALEELELSDMITISKEMYESIPDDYVRIGFTEGEVVTVEQCIYASLLKSANDACIALAIHVSGSEKAFVAKMNQRAEELGCTMTHFTNSYGYADMEHRTTCRDMALILEEALRHPDFKTIATSASYTIEPTNKYNDKRVLNNANRFVSTPSTAYEYYIGGKTGYSEAAGYTIIAGAEKDGRCLIGILLGADGAESRYETLISLFEYCFTNYTTTMVDRTEIDGAIQKAVEQIDQAVEGTDLLVRSTSLELLDCYSIKSSLANGGYSNEVDLSSLVIDPNENNQVFVLPVNRRFANNEAYVIGYITITVSSEDAVTETETAKDEGSTKTGILTIILTIGIATILIGVLILAIILFVKMVKKRRFNKNHRNPTIL
ncbi:MAG: D-alanyl-D-alanine carboxypeptidase [Clostridiales bacterium]|nr:D-alanyl-D-alanine carboxypeptidase [Clostridiales bacterium]